MHCQFDCRYEKKYIELTEEDRAKVTSVYHAWQQEGYEETYQNVPEFCYSASFDEVAEKGFTLVPSRYIEFVNRDENMRITKYIPFRIRCAKVLKLS